jgi:NADPH-dependent F420 reductase
MKIGIVGATGSFGRGLALRWAKKHTIYIGSRSPEKGEQKARDYQLELQKYGIDARIIGASNRDAIISGEVIVLSVKFEHLMPLITDSREHFHHKIVISPIVSLEKGQSFEYAPPSEGSVALLIQKMLPNSAIVSALHTIPANRLQRPDMILDGDVPVCGDNHEAKETVMNLIREIEQLNPIDAGPLEVSKLVEPIVPLILNIKQYGSKKNTSIKFV